MHFSTHTTIMPCIIIKSSQAKGSPCSLCASPHCSCLAFILPLAVSDSQICTGLLLRLQPWSHQNDIFYLKPLLIYLLALITAFSALSKSTSYYRLLLIYCYSSWLLKKMKAVTVPFPFVVFS